MLTASAALAGISTGESSREITASPRVCISLNGKWEEHREGKFWGTTSVPSSRRLSGVYNLRRQFVLPRLNSGARVYLHLEALTYWGQVSLNGEILGTCNPYVPQEFEFTHVASDGNNQVDVLIADLMPPSSGAAKPQLTFAVHSGFEHYGGIIRDVWVEIRPTSFIENLSLAYEFRNNYETAVVRPKVMISSTEESLADVQVVLRRHGKEVGRASVTAPIVAGVAEIEVPFDLEKPALWSPENPNLYELSAECKTRSTEDSWECRTGFREIRVEGREIRLNGKRIVLNGVCRHDMWKDQGFTLSAQQQELDMRLIKELGCNFVRLVHYPHHRRIVELADELGLLVSEEPGFWQANLESMEPSAIEVGFHVLEAAIRRDWNSPSVMIWFLANECTLTEKFLREGKQRCRDLDPIQRLVSAANDKPAEQVKPLFLASGLDLFDQHEYTLELDEMDQEAKFDGSGKPLIFSEWGGKSIGQAQPIMKQTIERLLELTESGLLSGHMFWSWQDVRQYSRIDGEMHDGILETGAVTESRDRRAIVWDELARLFAGKKTENAATDDDRAHLTILPLRENPFGEGNSFHTVDLQTIIESDVCARSWTSFRAIQETFWNNRFKEDQGKQTGKDFGFWQEPETRISGVLFRCAMVEGRVRPIVLTPESPEIVLPIHQPCTRCHILGQVSYPQGYPAAGNFGETAAVYTLEYANGQKETLPIRHGMEIAQSNCIEGASRIAPIATAAQSAIEFVRDPAREQYQILLWSVAPQRQDLATLRCRLNPAQPAIGIFAITLERE